MYEAKIGNYGNDVDNLNQLLADIKQDYSIYKKEAEEKNEKHTEKINNQET